MKTHCIVDDTEIDSSQCLECRCRMKECQEKREFFKELLGKDELLEKAEYSSEIRLAGETKGLENKGE